jgi:hypothetical protein
VSKGIMNPHIKGLIRSTGPALLMAGSFGLVTLAGLTAPSAKAAEIGINVGIEAGPPPPPQEVMVASPGPDYVWMGGYWDGSPGHYTWVRGHWGRPPHGHARWVAPRWERGHDGHFHKSEGGWR